MRIESTLKTKTKETVKVKARAKEVAREIKKVKGREKI